LPGSITYLSYFIATEIGYDHQFDIRKLTTVSNDEANAKRTSLE
ncbi:7860_t:CDS:1, partial [Entrophospora sp. SA101]